MGLGRMRERVNVYEIQNIASDDIGGFTTTKVLVGTFWAQVEENDGTRLLEGNRVSNYSPYQITIRSGTYKITTNNLLEWDGIEMTISSTMYQSDKRWTIIQADTNG